MNKTPFIKKYLCYTIVVAASFLCCFASSLTNAYADSNSQTAVVYESVATNNYCKDLDSRYYISRLDARLYSNFIALYNSVLNFESECRFPEEISDSELELLVRILHLDCPELFQIEGNASFTVYLTNDRITSISIPYIMSKSQYYTCLSQIRAAIATIKGNISSELSAFDKEMRAYDLLGASCVYDDGAYMSGSAYGALVLHKAKCDGISLAMKWILDELGIDSYVISGISADSGIGHAWDVVNIDGTYYDLDLSSDLQKDGVYTPLYYAANVSSSWIRSSHPVSGNLSKYYDFTSSQNMDGSFHKRYGRFISTGSSGDTVKSILFSQFDSASPSGTAFLQFENTNEFISFVGGLDDLLSEWSSTRKKNISISSSYSPEYRTIRILVNITS